ncbi:MAG: hypothetical protein V8Q17_09035 [Acutalibacteraceae bacterium]
MTYADGTPVDTSLYTVTKDETGRDVLTLNIDILTDKEVFLVKPLWTITAKTLMTLQ